MFFEASTMGDVYSDAWDGNPFHYINGILALNQQPPRSVGGGTPTTPKSTGSPLDTCIAALPGGVDLYGDCDYLIPLYSAPPRSTTNAGGTTPPSPPGETWDAWFKKNQTMIMFGGALLVIVLTKKK